MIAIVDYQMGNVQSVINAFEAVSAEVVLTADPALIQSAAGIVIPGVGAFRDGISNLRATGLIPLLEEEALKKKKPLLGICIGMQLLAEIGREHGEYPGLGWVKGSVEKIIPSDTSFRVPHMGWNNLENINPNSILFKNVANPAVVYFVHSYHFVPTPESASAVAAITNHGVIVTAAIEQDNIFGLQFHPEKSQSTGLVILKNFVDFVNRYA